MELSLDTASELASVALSQEGRLLAEITWRCRRNHTVELLPTIEKLLAQTGAAKDDLTAVFVCTGPGMYTGLRVGISTAKGLTVGLGLPVVGAGRLELDAYPHAAFPGPIVAVHRAGRGELAWAAYRAGPWRELSKPRLSLPEALARRVLRRTLFVGEVDENLAALLREASSGRAVIASPAASVRRAAALAELAFTRLSDGLSDDVRLLRPIYLRPPATGPQPGR
ncbi:MAG TPA: tRNA (adenosine(37)-N6)-threonylcarbamoyltransferase complex dimerization subunit type 1 TsaB [Dehalococcoidia bacterium]|nr:tRNA (adenosine(37)-N6)-threonylcarbamoyltransferase complex dimerization subunit type 1 TsaB [Dehalococcoidia bacterium]